MKHLIATSLLTLLAVPVTAQVTPYQCIPLRSTPSRTFVEAQIVVVQELDQIHVWSTVLKRWFSLPVSSTAHFYGFDDHVVIVDGTQMHAFATRHGIFASVPLSAPGPSVLSAPAPTWVSVVVDGNSVHLFSGFTGAWSTVALSGNAMASLDKLTAVVSDGTQTFGYSSQYGTPVPLGVTGATSVEAHGYGAFAIGNGQIHLFSAARNTWRSEPFGPTAAVVAPTPRAATIAITDSGTYRFWSAFTDDVRATSASPSALLTLGDHASVLIDGSMVHAFSAPAGTLTVHTFTAPSVAASSAYYVLLQDTNDLLAFSGPRGTWSLLPGGAQGSILSHSLSSSALVQDASGVTHCYSSLLGSWTATAAIANAVPYLSYAGGAILDPSGGGLYGFSALSGTLTHLPGILPNAVYQFGGNLCAQTGNRLDVFNPQLPAWRTHFTPGAAAVQLHHCAVVATTGNVVDFYGTYDDRWSRIVLPAVPSNTQASDECGYATTGTTVCGFGASGQLQNQAIFPEWWRLLTRGSKSTWYVVGEPGALPILIVGFAPADLTIPGIGRLLVDPTQAATAMLPPLPLVGASTVQLDVPQSPALSGLGLHAQAAIVRADAIYLTNVHRSMIF